MNRPIAIVLFGLLLAALWSGLANAASGQEANDQESAKDTATIAGDVRLILPSVIYATPGIECNIYFANAVLVLNRRNYSFDVTCEKGFQFEERWTFTPTPEECAEYPLVIEVRDETNRIVARGATSVHVNRLSPDRTEATTLLIVGASFVEYSIYPQHILDLSRSGDLAPLRLIGSRGAGNMPPMGDLRHEGYSGWTAKGFATLAGPLSRSGFHRRGATGSPFVYEFADGSKELDFARYCEEFNEGRSPDFVTVDLGGNDVFRADDETIDDVIDGMFLHYDALITAIQKMSPRTHIGVLSSTSPSVSQDGFRNYTGAGKQTRWQFHRNIHRLVERKIEHYDNRTDERIHLVPTYVNLDTEHHFPTWSPQLNARTADATIRVNNGTHPSTAGYQQIGDSVWSWIVGAMTETCPLQTRPRPERE